MVEKIEPMGLEKVRILVVEDSPTQAAPSKLSQGKRISSHDAKNGIEASECVASVFGTSLREDIDWAVRYGGEEFVVVLPETNMDGAVIAAERLR